MWSDMFQQNQLSTNTNIFTIGGHSLLIMQLFYQYKTKFHLETNTLSIADLFNIQQLLIMLNSFIKLLEIHKTSMIIIGIHYISLKVQNILFSLLSTI